MANETLAQILSAQNTYITNGEAARTRAEGKLDTTLTSLNALAAYRYPVYQNLVMQTALDDDYAAICTANDDFSDRSAVGLTIFMHAGETLGDHGYLLYVNGERVRGESFTCPSDGGVALVRCWLFAHDTLEFVTLSDETSLCVVEYVEKNGVSDSVTVTNRDWYAYAQRSVYNRSTGIPRAFTLRTNSYNTTSINANKIVELFGVISDNTDYDFGKISAQTFINHCTSFSGRFGNDAIGWNNPMLKLIYFPDVITVTGTCFKLIKSNVIFEKLQTISQGGTKNYNADRAACYQMKSVVLPETVQTISGNIFSGNELVVLNCKNATSIDPYFCTGAPTTFMMCGDWRATINLAVAAANWMPAQFIDLMENKLCDWTAEENGGYTFADDGYQRAITIPSEKLASIPSETIAAATAKLWDVTGG